MSNNPATEWSGRNVDKDQLRSEIWSLLKQQGMSRRDPFGHIPNFVGAEQAAEKLAELPLWQQAAVVKCNPDSPKSQLGCAHYRMENVCIWQSRVLQIIAALLN